MIQNVVTLFKRPNMFCLNVSLINSNLNCANLCFAEFLLKKNMS